MKQKKRRLSVVALLLAALFLLSGVPGASAVGKELTYEELFEEQKIAVDASQVLMQYFFENGWRTEYPEYYGGCYITDNILHIRLVSPSEKTMKFLENMFHPYAEAIVYEFCDFSLTESQKFANDVACELLESGCSITNWYVDNQTGSVVIGMLQDDIGKAAELLDSSCTYAMSEHTPEIVIKKGKYAEEHAEYVYGGTGVLIRTNLSIGICGTYDGQAAFVTCGHGNTEEGDAVIYNNRMIGTVSKVQFSNWERGDYAIVLMNYNAIATHKVGYSYELSTLTGGTILSPVVGTLVKKYGRTSGYGTGTVIATEQNVLYTNGKRIAGLTTVELSEGDSAEGDSGGPYMAANRFCGVHSGGSNDGDQVIAHFTPYSLINEAGFAAYGAHMCVSWSSAGALNHSGYCNICQETVYEEHSAYWNHTLGFCSRCGRSGSIAI